jgi:hypothetical protein
MTIRAKRNAAATAWIDQKIVEAGALDDPGLISALHNLKDESHMTSIRTLVKRAVVSLGGSRTEAERRATTVGTLCAVRSGLSHEGSSVDSDLGGAMQLARLVLNAAVRNPSILDIDRGEDARVRSGLQQREEWIVEADAAIRMVQPGCAAVVDAIRRPLIAVISTRNGWRCLTAKPPNCGKEKGPSIAAKPLNSFGRPYWIRTSDQRIKSPLLYQLS